MTNTALRARFRKTGQIWDIPASSRKSIAHAVVSRLKKTYGLPRFGNPFDPIDDLVYIVLSNRTGAKVATAVYGRLKAKFPHWEDLIRTQRKQLRKILKPAGLSMTKSEQILSALEKIKSSFNAFDLSELTKGTRDQAETYLVSLPGVSTKVARCVMMYTLGFKVLPVDIHTYRVAFRLGWTAQRRPDLAHNELEALIQPAMRYAFHVCTVAHGRTICRSKRPRCDQCDINRWCAYYKTQTKPIR